MTELKSVFSDIDYPCSYEFGIGFMHPEYQDGLQHARQLVRMASIQDYKIIDGPYSTSIYLKHPIDQFHLEKLIQAKQDPTKKTDILWNIAREQKPYKRYRQLKKSILRTLNKVDFEEGAIILPDKNSERRKRLVAEIGEEPSQLIFTPSRSTLQIAFHAPNFESYLKIWAALPSKIKDKIYHPRLSL